jgi:signal transduction histidine kinase
MLTNRSGPSATPRSAVLSRMLVILMLVVVPSFLVPFVVARCRGLSTDRDVNALLNDAVPGVVLLSSARSDLHQLDTYADAYVDAAEGGGAIPTDPIEEDRQAIASALARYVVLPSFAGDRATYEGLPGKLSGMDAAMERLFSAMTAGDLAAAGRARQDKQRAVEEVDVVLDRLIGRNAGQAQSRALSIARTRQSIIRTATALDCTAVLLSLAATTFAVVLLRRSVRPLEAQTHELSGFAGRVAHDVMSPLAGVSLSLEFLARRATNDPAGRAAAARGLSGVRRAGRIVEDLLEFARAGAQPDPTATADLKTVLEDVVEGLRMEAEAARVELCWRVPPACAVACSPGVLTSLVANVVRNAIKHMGDSVVRRVDVRVVAACGDRRRVEVVDTGPGIPPALGQSIFEPFVRGNTGPCGVGLGLATVRCLADAHRGHADFRSEPGRGSVFWFEIPVASQASGRVA